MDEAAQTFLVVAERELGCDPGVVPAGVLTVPVRLCRECGQKTGTPVDEATEGVPVLESSDDVSAA